MAWKVSYRSSFLKNYKKLPLQIQNQILDIADKIPPRWCELVARSSYNLLQWRVRAKSSHQRWKVVFFFDTNF